MRYEEKSNDGGACSKLSGYEIHEEDDWLPYLMFTTYFAALIFFGVGVDAVHGMPGRNVSQTLLTLIEDGGELVTIAAIGLSTFGMWLRQRRSAIVRGVPMESP